MEENPSLAEAEAVEDGQSGSDWLETVARNLSREKAPEMNPRILT